MFFINLFDACFVAVGVKSRRNFFGLEYLLRGFIPNRETRNRETRVFVATRTVFTSRVATFDILIRIFGTHLIIIIAAFVRLVREQLCS